MARTLPQNARSGRKTVLLLGCPNVGKSTLFNAMTGLKRHTGNWTGKTVDSAAGLVRGSDGELFIVDTPGCYSLDATSPEERIVRSALLSGRHDCVLVVCDAGCLARDLALVLQVIAVTHRCVIAVNLVDEAEKHGLCVNCEKLSGLLGVPVLPAAASKGRGIGAVSRAVRSAAAEPAPEPNAPEQTATPSFACPAERFAEAERIAAAVTTRRETGAFRKRLRLDRFLTGRFTGKLSLLLLLAAVFYLTMRGANYPSELLSRAFSRLLDLIRAGLTAARIPEPITSALCDGALSTLFTVTAVMLPPMAIFFPLFTFLEDAGLLPRFAFNADHAFSKCGSCGKQALPMCMGFGCNAAGVMGCRIIESPRERLIAQLTNSLVPCNGRFPILTALIPMLFIGTAGGAANAAALTLLVLLSVTVTFAVSRLLSVTLLRGKPSSFALELPPFRRPRVFSLILRSVIDRTLRVLGRAAAVAAPAGLIIHFLVRGGGGGLIAPAVRFLERPGYLLGVDGKVLAAFMLSLPANELFLPLLVMLYSGGSTVPSSAQGLAALLMQNGWGVRTVLCTLLLTLFHSPCATTLLTVKKETRSVIWTLAAFLIPSAVGAALCASVRLVFALFGL